jgi:hypothetical protein
MSPRFSLSFLALSSVLLISACVKPDFHLETQKITLKTPGAQNAKCFLQNDEFKYVAYSDQTITITRTAKDMNVTCMAEGNREKSLVVEHEFFDERARANALPDVITVSFVGQLSKAYDLPNYHNKDIGQYPAPSEVEYMGPSVTTTDSEPFPEKEPIAKRVYQSSNPFADSSSTPAKSTYDPREEDK